MIDIEEIKKLKEVIKEITEGREEKEGKPAWPSLPSLLERDLSKIKTEHQTTDFSEAHRNKNERCKTLQSIIATIEKIIEQEKYDFLNPHVASELYSYYEILMNPFRNFDYLVERVKNESNMSMDDIAQQCKIITNDFQSSHFARPELSIQLAFNKIFDLTSQIDSDGFFEKKRKEIEEDSKRAKKDLGEVEKMLVKSRDALSNISTGKASEAFAKRGKEHGQQKRRWFTGFIASSVALAATILWICFYGYDFKVTDGESGIAELIQFLKNFLLLGGVGVAFRVCLRKYNLERHLEIIYKGRVAALEQASILVDSIGDESAKNRLRLAIANIIFADPNTGLIPKDQNLNISPAVNVVEDMAKKIDG